jgi:hypothetical protein
MISWRVPDEFGDEDWEFVNGDDASTLEINILALPFDNGSEITDIEYRVDGGSAVSLGTTETGAYVLSGTVVGTEYDAEIRAVNGEGAGPWSSVQVGDPGRSARRLRSGRLDADRPCLRRRRARCDIRTPWQQRRGADAARLPDRRRNVAASHASPSVGNFDLLDVFTDGVEGDVEIRARNSAGKGTPPM